MLAIFEDSLSLYNTINGLVIRDDNITYITDWLPQSTILIKSGDIVTLTKTEQRLVKYNTETKTQTASSMRLKDLK
jgi:hypothetical protein